jgi:hypothetical protein
MKRFPMWHSGRCPQCLINEGSNPTTQPPRFQCVAAFLSILQPSILFQRRSNGTREYKSFKVIRFLGSCLRRTSTVYRICYSVQTDQNVRSYKRPNWGNRGGSESCQAPKSKESIGAIRNAASSFISLACSCGRQTDSKPFRRIHLRPTCY